MPSRFFIVMISVIWRKKKNENVKSKSKKKKKKKSLLMNEEQGIKYGLSPKASKTYERKRGGGAGVKQEDEEDLFMQPKGGKVVDTSNVKKKNLTPELTGKDELKKETGRLRSQRNREEEVNPPSNRGLTGPSSPSKRAKILTDPIFSPPSSPSSISSSPPRSPNSSSSSSSSSNSAFSLFSPWFSKKVDDNPKSLLRQPVSSKSSSQVSAADGKAPETLDSDDEFDPEVFFDGKKKKKPNEGKRVLIQNVARSSPVKSSPQSPKKIQDLDIYESPSQNKKQQQQPFSVILHSNEMSSRALIPNPSPPTRISFPGWKNEVVAFTNDEENGDGGRIIVVSDHSLAAHQKKISEVMNVVNSELGAVRQDLNLATMKVYLYISAKKEVLGCVLAERISHAYRLIPNPPSPNKFADHSGINSGSQSPVKTPAHSPIKAPSPPPSPLAKINLSEKKPALCGINRMWVKKSERRCGIAKKLVDAVRKTMFFQHEVSMDQLAFSQPTENGRAFAEKYTNMNDFLVYNEGQAREESKI